jgi:3-hydroxyacyl-[acyl-carrier-protein] dehydratase
MTLAVQILGEQRAPDEIILALALPPDHAAFEGHFPGRPILAGVIQIDWAVRLAVQYFQLKQRVAQDFQVKFRRIIAPTDALSLVLRRDPRGVSFEYRVAGEAATSGKIRLDPRA